MRLGQVWGQGILKALPPEQQRELLDIEFKRIHLNHVVGLLQYEIARLKRLESEFEAWRDWMRDANRHCNVPRCFDYFLLIGD